jgi:hypothetical protein
MALLRDWRRKGFRRQCKDREKGEIQMEISNLLLIAKVQRLTFNTQLSPSSKNLLDRLAQGLKWSVYIYTSLMKRTLGKTIYMPLSKADE